MVNRTEWSPVWSVIIRVIKQSRSCLICLIAKLITDRIGPRKVLLPIISIISIIKFKEKVAIGNFLLKEKKQIPFQVQLRVVHNSSSSWEKFLSSRIVIIKHRRRSLLGGSGGMPPPGNFYILSPQKWNFLDSEHKFPIMSVPKVMVTF